jgi:hypothetical protein
MLDVDNFLRELDDAAEVDDDTLLGAFSLFSAATLLRPQDTPCVLFFGGCFCLSRTLRRFNVDTAANGEDIFLTSDDEGIVDNNGFH